MSRALVFSVSLVTLSGLAPAQRMDEVRRAPGVPKDAGVYHLATDTWTRPGDRSTASLPGVIYNNTAPSGYFGTTSALEINWTDEGRLPSTSGHGNSEADTYTVTGFQIAYCSHCLGVPIHLGIEFYERYTACSDPRSLTPLFSLVHTVPGLTCTGSRSCWVLTFDLTGTTHEFDMQADGDGVFDGTSSLDNFGWEIHLDDGHTTTLSLGPILCYDPAGYFGCAAAEGDGTYYQTGTCPSPYSFGNYGSGLGLNDHHYSYAPGWVNGCYWFGGYSSTAPPSGFWMVIYGENGSSPGTNYCTGNTNTVGPGATISIEGSGSIAAADTVALAEGVPQQPGIFLHGSIPVAVPFGCGIRCTGGGVRRGTVVVAFENKARYAYDEFSAKRSLAGYENTTRYFQYWYRDLMYHMACGNTFNLSDGIALPIVP